MGHCPLVDPGSVHHMAPVDEAVVKFGLIHADCQHIGGSDRLTYIPVPCHSHRQGGAGRITASYHHRRPLFQPHSNQLLIDKTAHHISGMEKRRQFFHVDPDLVTDMGRPFEAAGRLEKIAVGRVGIINCVPSGHPQGHQRIDMAEIFRFFINLRQIAFNPKHGGSGCSSRHRGVGRYLKQLIASHRAQDYLCLFCASSVGIQNRVYQHLSIFSERGETGT